MARTSPRDSPPRPQLARRRLAVTLVSASSPATSTSRSSRSIVRYVASERERGDLLLSFLNQSIDFHFAALSDPFLGLSCLHGLDGFLEDLVE